MSEMVRFEGAAGSAAKLQTPHYIRQYGTAGADTNQDYARFTGAGLFLADGVGTTEGAQIAALLAVQAASHRATALRINQMGAEEAESAVRENVLPYADEMIARYRMEKKVERAATTLGALVIARNAVVAIAIGDTRVYGIRPGGPTSMVRLGVDQQVDGQLTNTLAGRGRTPRGARIADPLTGNVLPSELIEDFVLGFEVEAGDRYAIMTDGIGGNVTRPASCLPPSVLRGNIMPMHAATPEQAVNNLLTLPDRYMQTNAMLETGDGWFYYDPPIDDASAGVLFVSKR